MIISLRRTTLRQHFTHKRTPKVTYTDSTYTEAHFLTSPEKTLEDLNLMGRFLQAYGIRVKI